MSEIRARLAGAGLDPAREAEIALELSEHLDQRYGEMRRAGASEEDARRAALDELKEDAAMRSQLIEVAAREPKNPTVLGDTRRRSFVADIWQDARYAFRVLSAHRGFTALALLTLALGVASTTIIYSVVDHMLLRPLPYPDPDRLVGVFQTETGRAARQYSPSYPNFADWRARSRSFDAMGLQAYVFGGFVLMDGDDPQRASASRVTPDFFRVIGFRPALGRAFTDDDCRPGAPLVAVISHGAWQRRFGLDPAIVGRIVRTIDGPHEVVGVLPEGFNYDRDTDFWLPFRPTPAIASRGAGMYTVVARLSPAVTLQQAATELDGIGKALASEYPQTNSRSGVALVPLHEETVGHLRPTLQMLLGAAGCILLIGCLNVAGLLVVRGAGRAREIAVRASLGAGRSRIARQLVTESVVLALAGGAVGALLAWSGIAALIPLLPVRLPGDIPVTVDGRILTIALIASTLTGLLFGAAPALQLSRASCTGALKDGSGATSRWGRRIGVMLVLVEVALSLVLLAGAGLMVQTLRALNSVPAGVDADHTLALTASPLLPPGSDPARRTAFYRTLLERVAAVPGVASAAAIDTAPFNSTTFTNAAIDRDDVKKSVSPRWITPGYFGTMGIPFVAGRDLASSDGPGAPCVAIVNQFAAGQLWPGQSPLGRRLRVSGDADYCQVVGVVGDVHHQGPLRDVLSEVYRPALQTSGLAMTIVARAANAAAVAPAIAAQAARASERALPGRVATFASMNDRYKDDARHRAILLGLIGGIGILLAAVGVFGLTSYSVAQRTREIGLRVALGATRSQVIRSVVGALVPFIAGGIALGLFGAWGATRIVAQFLFGVTPTDRPTFAVVTLLLAIVALTACILPARRALRVDPVTALRSE